MREKLNVHPSALFEGNRDGEVLMHCPVCGFDYTHPLGAYTRLGSDAFEGGSPYSGTEPLGVTGERRGALVVVCSCESGHRFALVIQQHKGQNSCWVERWPNIALDADGGFSSDDAAFTAWLIQEQQQALERIAQKVQNP